MSSFVILTTGAAYKYAPIGRYDLTKESFLAETSLALYSKTNFESVYSQHQYREKDKRVQTIIPDIIFESRNKLIVIDCKVYRRICTDSNKYISNANRFQVNSYIGRCLQDDYANKDIEVQGIILHIVNAETMEKYKGLNRLNITVEEKRPIKLILIEDKGLDYILQEYDKLIRELL